jgi:hypothetical protein
MLMLSAAPTGAILPARIAFQGRLRDMRIPLTPKGAVALLIVCLLVVTAVKFGPGIFRWLTSKGAPRRAAPVSAGDLHLLDLDNPRVLVEKGARRLTVFSVRKPVKSYRIALGWGGGDKEREGDGRTPEGEFYICAKNPNSRFYLSLGLSYPNIEDAERGLRDGLINRDQYEDIISAIRRDITPPWKTPLGGEIMLHGHGTHRDWTAGCVAMANEDIAQLYEALPVGTPVEIVP